MRGGVPGAFPKFSDHTSLIPHPVPLNLFDPFGFSKNKSAEDKASGLVKELNNGRLAQIGILGFLILMILPRTSNIFMIFVILGLNSLSFMIC